MEVITSAKMSLRILPRPGIIPEKINSSLKVLLLCDSENSLVKRVANALKERKINVKTTVTASSAAMTKAASQHSPDIIICPYMKSRVPEIIYRHQKRPCLIVHPGVAGDRGASSIDWAIHDKREKWGVTVLQADKEMDAGDIWSTSEFGVRQQATKTSMYVGDVSDHSVKCVLDAVSRFTQNIRPVSLNYSHPEVWGTLMPNMKKGNRVVDWNMSADEIVRRVRMSDTQPGALASIPIGGNDVSLRLFDAYVENGESSHLLRSYMGKHRPGDRIAHKYGAVLFKTGDENGVWIGQMKRIVTSCHEDKDYDRAMRKYVFGHMRTVRVLIGLRGRAVRSGPSLSANRILGYNRMYEWRVDFPHIKLPSTEIFKSFSTLHDIPELPFQASFSDIRVRRSGPVCFVHFDFYNGAMDKQQASRLESVIRNINKQEDVKAIVLMGGRRFFSTGIHLCAIQNSDNKSKEAWENINKIDDVILALSEVKGKVTIAVLQGNAGAGGAMLAAACDVVLSHPGALVTPSYKAMCLYGSEYWTYFLPRRVGQETAQKLVASDNSISAKAAKRLGLIDDLIELDREQCEDHVEDYSNQLLYSGEAEKIISEKMQKRNDDWFQNLALHRENELEEMKINFKQEAFLNAMKAFVYHQPVGQTPISPSHIQSNSKVKHNSR